MRRNIFVALLCLLLAFVVVSCAEPEHVHSFTEEWTSDGLKHWHECGCGYKSEEIKHEWVYYNGKEATCEESGYNPYKTCSICGYSTRSEITNGHVLLKYNDASTGYTGDLYKCTRTGCGMIFFDENGTKEVEAYTITYATVDEAGDGNPTTYIRSSEADKNTEVTISGVPVKAGFTFKGWKLSGTDEEPVTTYTISAETAEDITLEAVWNDTYNITYVNLYSAIALSDTTPGTYKRYATGNNEKVEISSYVSNSVDGYFFKGWRLEGEEDYTASNPYIIEEDTAGDITLVAVWQKNLTQGAAISAKGDVIELGVISVEELGVKSVEPITWRALAVDTENKCALLLSENILEDNQIDSKSNFYENSYIRQYLNNTTDTAYSDGTYGFFKKYGLSTAYMKNVDVTSNIEKTVVGSGSDYVFLLSKAEAENKNYFEDYNARKSTADWWLRSKNDGSSGVGYCVQANDSRWLITGLSISKGIRPAFWYCWK